MVFQFFNEGLFRREIDIGFIYDHERAIAEVFDDDHDRRFLIDLSHDFPTICTDYCIPIVVMPSSNATERVDR